MILFCEIVTVLLVSFIATACVAGFFWWLITRNGQNPFQ